MPRRAVALPVTLALALASLVGVLGLPTAGAATPPALVQPDSSTGVTADVLPTTQINPGGWVQDQVVGNDTVYAGGSFSSARPAGAAPGTDESPRNNLLAYSISSGDLDAAFLPHTDGPVYALALSPDRSRLYVGGDFKSSSGGRLSGLVAIRTSDGQVDKSFAPNVAGPVYAIAVSSDTVYAGGQFSQANGNNRGRLAAFRTDGQLLGWSPKTIGILNADGTAQNAAVQSMVVAPNGRVIVGGYFASIGSGSGSFATVSAPGSASLDPVTGAPQAWAVNKTVRQFGSSGAVLSLRTDGTTVYGSGYWFGGTDSNFEGVWAVDPADGSIRWLADCHGDTYDTTVANGVVYEASHQHDCSNIGSFPQQRPSTVEWRANAVTADARGDVLPNSYSPTKFKDFTGFRAPAVVDWFPQFAMGASSGRYAGQATLTIESTSDYVVVGGQFPTVNGKAQQGLVRFARGSIAPKNDGPRVYFSDPGSANASSLGAPSVRAVGANRVRVVAAPWDRDDAVLSKVELLRDDVVVPEATLTGVTAAWWQPAMAFIDTGVSAGTSYSYRLRMTDTDGNTTTSDPGTVTPSGSALTDSTYSRQVLADHASSYWRLDDPSSGSSITDWAGSTDLTRASGMTLGATGALGTDKAASVNATVNASAAGTNGYVRAPQSFSVEAWFKTTSTTGGQVVGFGDVPSGSSYRHDRQVYLNPSGQVVFNLDQNGTSRSITSPKAYNDGAFHQVDASLSGSSGMELYVDGAKVASWSSITSARDYGGFWRIGADKLPGTATGYLGGTIDDVSVYPAALSATQIRDHFVDTGRTAATAPTAAFTTSCSGLACSFDGSASTEGAAGATQGAAGDTVRAAAEASTADPLTYAWSFGDGGNHRSTAAKVAHAYRTAKEVTVTLTVTNAGGDSASTTTTLDAKGNTAPVASLRTTARGRKVTFDGSRSKDSDGTITAYRWSFGDGATSSKKKVVHTFAGTGNYVVTLTVTDDARSTGTMSAVVRVGKALASDTFQRTAAGWGSASKGGAWTTNPRSAFSVDGQRGVLTLRGHGASASATLGKVSTKQANVVGDLNVDKAGTGGTTAGYVLRQRANADYRVKVVLRSGGTLDLVASRRVGGKETAIRTVKVRATYKAGEALRFRATISSATKARIRATVWPAGTKEPKAQLSATDSTSALRRSGAVGVSGSRGQSATNAPVVLGFDNLLVTPS